MSTTTAKLELSFGTLWPFASLLLSIVTGIPLFTNSAPGPRSFSGRLQDWRWLMAFALPLYAFHQFEEYGIDLRGRHLQFWVNACLDLGYIGLSECTIRPWHLGITNFVFINLAGYRAGGKSAKAATSLGANFYAIAIVNGILHVVLAVGAILKSEDFYNPGLITGSLALVPLGSLALRSLHNEGLLSSMGVARAMAVGVAGNALMIGSIPLRAYGYVGNFGFNITLVIDLVLLPLVSTPS